VSFAVTLCVASQRVVIIVAVCFVMTQSGYTLVNTHIKVVFVEYNNNIAFQQNIYI